MFNGSSNGFAPLKIDGKHDLLTFFSSRGQKKTQQSLSRRAREVADEAS